ncbi:hypothetical protein HY639_02255 [Candidatus Woesearchaeota archaeon]|nr:hypothetical protein [Candidatus Woesearchaeota archaeon]
MACAIYAFLLLAIETPVGHRLNLCVDALKRFSLWNREKRSCPNAPDFA